VRDGNAVVKKKILKWTFCLTKGLNISPSSAWAAEVDWGTPLITETSFVLDRAGIKEKIIFFHCIGLRFPPYIQLKTYRKIQNHLRFFGLLQCPLSFHDLFIALNFQISCGIASQDFN